MIIIHTLYFMPRPYVFRILLCVLIVYDLIKDRILIISYSDGAGDGCSTSKPVEMIASSIKSLRFRDH